MIIAFIVAAAIITLDQVLKVVFKSTSVSLIGDFLWIQSATNDGAAFSMLSGARWFFVAFAILVCAAIIYLLIAKKISTHRLFTLTMGIMLGGIIGNLIDRIAFGYVRDFIYFKSINFAIFNIADIALTVSCVMLIVYTLFFYKPKPNKSKLPNGENK